MVDKKKIDQLNEQAWIVRRNEMDKSLELAQTAYNKSLDIKYDKGQFVSLLNMGINEVYHNNYKQAMNHLFKAMKYFSDNDLELHQIRALNTIGMVYIIRGDFTKALMVLNRGLNIARSHSDKEMIVYILYNIAEIYKFSYQLHDKALPYLIEASKYCQDNPHALCGAVLSSLSNCFQQTGESQQALEYAQLALKKAELLQDKISLGLCHEMLCSLKKDMGEYDEAWSHCHKSLAYRKDIKDEFAQANVWLVMSQISLEKHKHDHAIAYAEKAIAIAKPHKTDSILVHLYLVMAKAYQSKGRFDKSSEYYERYIALNNQRISKELENRISILTSEMRNKTLNKDMEIYKLKNVELKKKNDEIELINQIGQQITASLDVDKIVQLIYERINQLMDVSFLGVGFYDSQRNEIHFKHLREAMKTIPEMRVSIDERRSYAVKCFIEDQLIYISDLENNKTETIKLSEKYRKKQIKSILYAPLNIGGSVIGVITIQSEKANAYDDKAIEIFKSMSNYIAIALNNASQKDLLMNTASELRNTLNDLREAQNYIVQTEKFAALGSLIAGVAHEINTPLGTSITLGSFIADQHKSLWANVEENNLTKKALDNYLSAVEVALNGLDKNLSKTAEIVNSFKLVAVDQSRLDLRKFNIFEYVNDILIAYRSKYKNTGHEIHLICNENWVIQSYPGIFAHIISHLLMNSIDHGFKNGDKGKIEIIFEMQEGMLHMCFRDNGAGIPGHVLEHVFEPFFSTSKSLGSIGLGLHAIYNMVTQALLGTIDIKNNEGGGVCVDIYTPTPLIQETSPR